MDNETDAEVRSEQSGGPRPKRVVERFDFDTGQWHRIELEVNDEIFEMEEDVQVAYLDIIATIGDMLSNSEDFKDKWIRNQKPNNN